MTTRTTHNSNADRARGCAIGLLLLAAPTHAMAYSDPDGFLNEAVTDGGGQGRMFTGSPTDGYTCEVCHSGGRKLNVNILSFPSVYLPGQTYEITVRFSEAAAHIGAALEITDRSGAAAGTITLPEESQLTAADQCVEFPVPAVRVSNPVPGREVVGLTACGAQQIHFQWTAPPVPLGPLNFTGAVVNGDGGMATIDEESDFLNDGVTAFNRKILSTGQSEFGDVLEGGCAARRPATGRWATWTGFGVGIVAILLNRRRRRRRSPRAGCR